MSNNQRTTPSLNIDFVGGETIVVLGVSFGIGY